MTLRCLLATALLTLVPAGAYADEAEEKAVAAVNKLGGRVYPVDRQPGQPVVAVEFYDKHLQKGDLKVLAAFQQLEGLHLLYSTLPDAELKELTALLRLKTLDLSRVPVTDAGMRELAGLQQLQMLNLSATKVTDAGLKE